MLPGSKLARTPLFFRAKAHEVFISNFNIFKFQHFQLGLPIPENGFNGQITFGSIPVSRHFVYR
jgi:hypothetical protein